MSINVSNKRLFFTDPSKKKTEESPRVLKDEQVDEGTYTNSKNKAGLENMDLIDYEISDMSDEELDKIISEAEKMIKKHGVIDPMANYRYKAAKKEREKRKNKKFDNDSATFEERRKYIWDYLKNKGLSDVQAAAIIGNLQQESRLSSTFLEGTKNDFDTSYINNYDTKDGKGWGLAQWTYHTRKQGLYDFAKKNGTDVGDFKTQLDFLFYEMENNHKKAYQKFKTIKNIDDATEYFCNEIERPGTPRMDNRKKYAKEALEALKKN